MAGHNPVLPPVPNLEGKDVRANWNATALAYLGDAVWEVGLSALAYFCLFATVLPSRGSIFCSMNAQMC